MFKHLDPLVNLVLEYCLLPHTLQNDCSVLKGARDQLLCRFVWTLIHLQSNKEKSNATKSDFRALGLAAGSGAQVVISSVLLLTTNNIGRKRQIHQANVCGSEIGVSGKILGLLTMEGSTQHLFYWYLAGHTQRGKRALAQELVGLVDRTLT